MRTIRLQCFNIAVKLDGAGGGAISSDMAGDIQWGETPEEDCYRSGIDAIESMILCHAIAGVNIEGLAYVQGIEEAVDKLRQETL